MNMCIVFGNHTKLIEEKKRFLRSRNCNFSFIFAKEKKFSEMRKEIKSSLLKRKSVIMHRVPQGMKKKKGII
jgi:hypothetical protein